MEEVLEGISTQQAIGRPAGQVAVEQTDKLPLDIERLAYCNSSLTFGLLKAVFLGVDLDAVTHRWFFFIATADYSFHQARRKLLTLGETPADSPNIERW